MLNLWIGVLLCRSCPVFATPQPFRSQSNRTLNSSKPPSNVQSLSYAPGSGSTDLIFTIQTTPPYPSTASGTIPPPSANATSAPAFPLASGISSTAAAPSVCPSSCSFNGPWVTGYEWVPVVNNVTITATVLVGVYTVGSGINGSTTSSVLQTNFNNLPSGFVFPDTDPDFTVLATADGSIYTYPTNALDYASTYDLFNAPSMSANASCAATPLSLPSHPQYPAPTTANPSDAQGSNHILQPTTFVDVAFLRSAFPDESAFAECAPPLITATPLPGPGTRPVIVTITRYTNSTPCALGRNCIGTVTAAHITGEASLIDDGGFMTPFVAHTEQSVPETSSGSPSPEFTPFHGPVSMTGETAGGGGGGGSSGMVGISEFGSGGGGGEGGSGSGGSSGESGSGSSPGPDGSSGGGGSSSGSGSDEGGVAGVMTSVLNPSSGGGNVGAQATAGAGGRPSGGASSGSGSEGEGIAGVIASLLNPSSGGGGNAGAQATAGAGAPSSGRLGVGSGSGSGSSGSGGSPDGNGSSGSSGASGSSPAGAGGSSRNTGSSAPASGSSGGSGSGSGPGSSSGGFSSGSSGGNGAGIQSITVGGTTVAITPTIVAQTTNVGGNLVTANVPAVVIGSVTATLGQTVSVGGTGVAFTAVPAAGVGPGSSSSLGSGSGLSSGSSQSESSSSGLGSSGVGEASGARFGSSPESMGNLASGSSQSPDLSGELIVGGTSTVPLGPLETAASSLEQLPGITVGGSVVEPTAVGDGSMGFVIGSQTLAPGHPITLGSGSQTTVLSLTTNGLGETLLISGSATITLEPVNAPDITLGSQTFEPTSYSNGAVGYVIGGQTLSWGHPITVGSGSQTTVLSLTTDGAGNTLLVEGSRGVTTTETLLETPTSTGRRGGAAAPDAEESDHPNAAGRTRGPCFSGGTRSLALWLGVIIGMLGVVLVL